MTVLQDYIDQWFEKLEKNGDFALPVEVAKFCDHYRTKFPHQWKDWITEHDQIVVAQLLGSLVRAARAQAKSGTEGVTDEKIASWLNVTYVIDEDNTRRHLRDMTGGDLRFVAKAYDTQAKASAFEAAFLRALAKKAGSRKVGDVLNDEQIESLRSVIGSL